MESASLCVKECHKTHSLLISTGAVSLPPPELYHDPSSVVLTI